MNEKTGGGVKDEAAEKAGAVFRDLAKDISAKMEKAWNEGDSKGFAGLFTEQADLISLTGGYVVGRERIEKSLASAMKAATTRYAVTRVKPLANDVAMVLMVQEITQRAGEGRVLRARPTVTLRKVQGAWKIVCLQSTRLTGQGGQKGAADAAEKPAKPAKAKAAKSK